MDFARGLALWRAVILFFIDNSPSAPAYWTTCHPADTSHWSFWPNRGRFPPQLRHTPPAIPVSHSTALPREVCMSKKVLLRPRRIDSRPSADDFCRKAQRVPGAVGLLAAFGVSQYAVAQNANPNAAPARVLLRRRSRRFRSRLL